MLKYIYKFIKENRKGRSFETNGKSIVIISKN